MHYDTSGSNIIGFLLQWSVDDDNDYAKQPFKPFSLLDARSRARQRVMWVTSYAEILQKTPFSLAETKLPIANRLKKIGLGKEAPPQKWVRVAV